ncbi:MAG TPA: hypothetical protein VEQ65_11120 [Opitutus sp.]|nr:hypothetical protein [Opitutus sp.]
MGSPSYLDPHKILQSLRTLNERVSVPLWLFGGVAVDFLVGRWTRPHGDIDLNTYSETRDVLATELQRIGYATSDQGWLTHWGNERTGERLEIVFLERTEHGEAELRIPPGAQVGVPGRYPLLPGYLDPGRRATLGGVTFRVCSPAGEWLGRKRGVVAGRVAEPKIAHDLQLLETLIPPDELAKLEASMQS